MQELWKPIPGYDDRYEVSDMGRVRRISPRWGGPPIILAKRSAGRPTLDGKCYLGVSLWSSGKRPGHSRAVHRIVAEAFLGDSNGKHVNHIDGNKHNNQASNLEYCSPKENSRHAWKMGLLKQPPIGIGSSNGRAKISAETAVKIYEQLKKTGIAETARILQVSRNTVNDIKVRRKWGSVLGALWKGEGFAIEAEIPTHPAPAHPPQALVR